MSDSTNRFSDRVADYVRSRPHYPDTLLELLQSEMGLGREHIVADVGSGTGILTQMLLKNGNTVYAVEPNEPMRHAAEEALARYPRFHSVSGTAESTTLPDRSVDFITAAQAFHWFDIDRTRKEFARVLRPRGWVVLIWNDRRDGVGFEAEYERILKRFNTDMDRVHHRNVIGEGRDSIDRFFGTGGHHTACLDNHQELDLAGVTARVLSSSYMPHANDPDADAMLRELTRAFESHQTDGRVRIEYDTRVYFGRLQ